jgi:hypothetical protein
LQNVFQTVGPRVAILVPDGGGVYDWAIMNAKLGGAANAVAFVAAVCAQAQEPIPSTATARERAPYDLTGTWVSIVTEDWRWRMMTPPVGDYASVPMTDAARAIADAWDLEADLLEGNACRPYGAGGIMRVPGRLQISWADAETLRIDTDAGTQTRLFHFGAFEPSAEPTWQGSSVAEWEMVGATRGQPPTGGSLKVVTTEMKAGYVRWNGVPYSENAVITEYFDRHDAFDEQWFTVTTVIEDPIYFTQPFIVSSHFRKEPDDSRWSPTPCVTDPPAAARSDTAD